MTDKYGSEAEGHEPGTENDPAATPESWQGDQPPVDDFADPEHAEAEGPATVSEEAEADAVEVPVDESVNPPKKSSAFPMLIGLVGIVLIGGLVYFQFFGGAALLKSTSAANPVQAHKQAAGPPAVMPQTPTSGASGANDIANLKAPPTDAASSVPSQTAALPPSGVAMPSPGSPQPPFPTPSAPNAETAPSFQPSTVPPLTAGSLETQVSTLSARVEALQKSLDQTTQQLSQLNAMVNALQVAPSSPPAVVAMEDRLSKIEQDVLKLEQSSTAMAKPLPIPAAAIKPVHHPKPKATKPLQTSAMAPRPTVKPLAALAPAPVSWVLRAATPGEAWVSQSTNASVLQHIQVGDDLPGLGHVNAIKQDGGRWTIEGTQGTIH